MRFIAAPVMYFRARPEIGFLAAIGALALQSSAVVGAPQANKIAWKSYEPEAKWVVDFDDQRCFGYRRFRSDSETLVFGISPWLMFEWAKIVIEKPGDLDGIVSLRGKVRVDDGNDHEVVMFAADSINQGKVIYTFNISGEAFDELKVGKRIRIQTRQLSADISISNMTPVLGKLGECLPLLFEHWGFSREKQATLASFPSHEKKLPLKSSDYPTSAIRRGAVGAVEVLLNIGTDGRPLDCRLVRSSGHKDLDDTTCERLMARGKFKPGLDRSGNAVPSPFFFSVYWAFPN